MKCICEECFEIVESLTWAVKFRFGRECDLLLCENCELNQGNETELTPEKRELLKSQREHFENWKKDK